MKLWLISQNINDDYDTYDSAVVVAKNEEEARRIHPNGQLVWDGATLNEWGAPYSTWVHPSNVQVTLIGTARKGLTGVVCASFNAG